MTHHSKRQDAASSQARRSFPAFCAAALMLVFLCGCFQVKDELTLAPDGSGTVRMEVKAQDIPNAVSGNLGQVMYPPTSAAEARKFFPAKDFTVTLLGGTNEESDQPLVFEAAFKDVNALLASPYGAAHGLTLAIDKGALQFKAVSGAEFLARGLEITNMGAMGAFAGTQAKLATNKMCVEFRLVLPNAIASCNGQKDGKAAAWVVDQEKSKDTAEFIFHIGAVMEASCPAEGVTFSPTTPLRLKMSAFKDLPAGEIRSTGALPDPEKVAQAARFVPYALRVTRSLDLSGESSARESQAALIGEIVVPQELAPQSWGAVEVEDVIDAKGNSLKFKAQDAERYSYSSIRSSMDEREDGESAAPAKDARHEARVLFQAPDWKVKEIASIKASMKLVYYGGGRLLVFSNAIPADWIQSAKKARFSSSGSEHIIHSANPQDAGLGFRVEGVDSGGYTMFTIMSSGEKGELSEVAFFDADGKVVPSVLQHSDIQSVAQQLAGYAAVIGNFKTPLSLALVIKGGAKNVTVPISLEHVPVTGN